LTRCLCKKGPSLTETHFIKGSYNTDFITGESSRIEMARLSYHMTMCHVLISYISHCITQLWLLGLALLLFMSCLSPYINLLVSLQSALFSCLFLGLFTDATISGKDYTQLTPPLSCKLSESLPTGELKPRKCPSRNNPRSQHLLLCGYRRRIKETYSQLLDSLLSRFMQ